MIIEFTGPAGAGKTTLVNATVKRLKSEGFQNIYTLKIRTFKAFLDFAFAARKHWPLLKMCFSITTKLDITLYHKLNLYRNIIKKISLNEMIDSGSSNIYIVDEGPLHIFQNFVDGNPSEDKLIQFEGLFDTLPKPDLLVIINAKADQIQQRITKRGHRRLSDQGRLDDFIHNGLTYSKLVKRFLKKNKLNYKVFDNSQKNQIDTVTKQIISACAMLFKTRRC